MVVVYCDENVWSPVAKGLERRGWRVRTAVEEDTLGFTDLKHVEHARENGWVILTFDDDFLGLVESMDENNPTVIYVSQHDKDVGELVQRVDTALEVHELEEHQIIYA